MLQKERRLHSSLRSFSSRRYRWERVEKVSMFLLTANSYGHRTKEPLYGEISFSIKLISF